MSFVNSHVAETAAALKVSDSILAKSLTPEFEKNAELPSDELLEKTKAALTAKGFNVIVVATKEEGLEAVTKLIPSGSSIHNGHSTTLEEIGFIEEVKKNTSWKNLNGLIHAEKDQAKAAELRKQAHFADYYLCSPSAISSTGDLVAADLTGTKTGPIAYDAGKVIFVSGANKIVPTFLDAIARTENYALPMESARARLVYGVPASQIGTLLAIRNPSPYAAPGRYNVVIIKESLGF